LLFNDKPQELKSVYDKENGSRIRYGFEFVSIIVSGTGEIHQGSVMLIGEEGEDGVEAVGEGGNQTCFGSASEG
jgi:hypothetical protein